MNIYVGNLSYSVGGDQLRTLFEAYGTVDSASVAMDKFTRVKLVVLALLK